MRNNTKITNSSPSITAWSYDVGGHAARSVARNCELACTSASFLKLPETSCMDAHHFFPKKISTVCENWHEWGTDCVDMTALRQKTRVALDVPRLVTKWNKACAKILARLTSYMKNTKHCTQHCVVLRHE